MGNFNLKSHLNFNGKKRFVPCLNENWQRLATINFDEVYEGYKITFTKIESKNTSDLVYYEASSNVHSRPNTFKTLVEMCDFYNEWKDELNSK
tara:strand:- start:51 stop:329 length:279 start_codon:yes stop_codon:yes gene_type:complete